MMDFTELASLAPDPAELLTDRLRLAVAAYLGRFTGSSREHTESDLRCYLVGAENLVHVMRPGGIR
jgi:hypothetical protein